MPRPVAGRPLQKQPGVPPGKSYRMHFTLGKLQSRSFIYLQMRNDMQVHDAALLPPIVRGSYKHQDASDANLAFCR
jgi:hypothetical protein